MQRGESVFKRCRWVAAALAVAVIPTAARAVVLYSTGFEAPVTTASSAAGPGGFVQLNNLGGSNWQVQGGGGGAGAALTAGIDTNGVGGSQALFANWDHSAAASFTFNQYTIYGAVAAPGAGVLPSQVQVDLDIFMSGSETSNTPIDVAIQNGGPDISFTPTLTNDTYTHVSFTLDQASNSASFNPLTSSNLRLQHGAGGFGFDANNIVRVDNIVIQTVPEPMALAAIGALAVLGMRRRSR